MEVYISRQGRSSLALRASASVAIAHTVPVSFREDDGGPVMLTEVKHLARLKRTRPLEGYLPRQAGSSLALRASASVAIAQDNKSLIEGKHLALPYMDNSDGCVYFPTDEILRFPQDDRRAAHPKRRP